MLVGIPHGKFPCLGTLASKLRQGRRMMHEDMEDDMQCVYSVGSILIYKSHWHTNDLFPRRPTRRSSDDPVDHTVRIAASHRPRELS